MSVLIDEADLVITLGFDMVEYHPKLWNPGCDKNIIHADMLPAEIDKNYHPQIELIGDVNHTLEELNLRAKARAKFMFNSSHQTQVRKEMLEDIAEYKDDDTKGSVRPQKAIWDARQVLGQKDILLSDVGAHKMWIARYYQCHEPNTCLISNGFCSMGFALPGAIAANLVYPERRVLGVAGDAGFLMNVQELLAKSFGWNGYFVKDSTDLQPTLETAFNDGGPSLVVVPIDYRENMLLTKRLGELTMPM